MFPFLLSSFLGAFLLFQVQPIAGRILTPHFGGSVSVWTTCLLFFQWALLAGYGWAHWIANQNSIQSARKRHGLLLGLSLLPLPLGLWLSYFQLNASYHPIPQIFFALLLGIGLPYIALASTAPLIQAWFHRVYPTEQPWRLYALSNFGSLLALITYPTFEYVKVVFSRIVIDRVKQHRNTTKNITMVVNRTSSAMNKNNANK